MTTEPEQHTKDLEAGTEHAGHTRHVEVIGDARTPSPYRILFAIVPLIVIAVVGTLLLLELWRATGQHVEHSRDWEGETFELPAPDTSSPAAESAEFDIEAVLARLADADPDRGGATFRQCIACHSAEKDAPVRIGPNLWGIINRAKAADRTYAYSAVLRAKGGTWSYRELAGFLHDPRRFAPGTTMAYRGIADSNRMADLLAYLGTLKGERPALHD